MDIIEESRFSDEVEQIYTEDMNERFRLAKSQFVAKWAQGGSVVNEVDTTKSDIAIFDRRSNELITYVEAKSSTRDRMVPCMYKIQGMTYDDFLNGVFNCKVTTEHDDIHVHMQNLTGRKGKGQVTHSSTNDLWKRFPKKLVLPYGTDADILGEISTNEPLGRIVTDVFNSDSYGLKEFFLHTLKSEKWMKLIQSDIKKGVCGRNAVNFSSYVMDLFQNRMYGKHDVCNVKIHDYGLMCANHYMRKGASYIILSGRMYLVGDEDILDFGSIFGQDGRYVRIPRISDYLKSVNARFVCETRFDSKKMTFNRACNFRFFTDAGKCVETDENNLGPIVTDERRIFDIERKYKSK